MEVKKGLYDYCLTYIRQRIDGIREALLSARESAEEETKSSSGDKYETGRAMMQIEIENQMIQLTEARRLEEAMQGIRPTIHSGSIVSGSLVKTSAGIYYLAIGIGRITWQEQEYLVIASSSPIGQMLIGKSKGDHVLFNEKKIEILEVS